MKAVKIKKLLPCLAVVICLVLVAIVAVTPHNEAPVTGNAAGTEARLESATNALRSEDLTTQATGFKMLCAEVQEIMDPLGLVNADIDESLQATVNEHVHKQGEAIAPEAQEFLTLVCDSQIGN